MPQQSYVRCEVFKGLRHLVNSCVVRRALPNDLSPRTLVCSQRQRWLAAILDGRTLQSAPESADRVGNDSHERKGGFKTHAAFDTLVHLLALVVTPFNAQERDQVASVNRRVSCSPVDRCGRSDLASGTDIVPFYQLVQIDLNLRWMVHASALRQRRRPGHSSAHDPGGNGAGPRHSWGQRRHWRRGGWCWPPLGQTGRSQEGPGHDIPATSRTVS